MQVLHFVQDDIRNNGNGNGKNSSQDEMRGRFIGELMGDFAILRK